MSATLAEPITKFADRTLADIATALPGATAAFRKRKLDFCCGGNMSLREAAAARNIDLADLESVLTLLADSGAVVGRPHDVIGLIDLIETRFHATHRAELPELVRLARRVEAVHRDNPDVPVGLASLLERVAAELEQHMQKEEQILFPMMRRGGHPMIAQPIAVMLAEHDDHGASLRALEALTHDFTPPAGACTTWRALYAGARKLADDLMEHIHTENNVLFPHFAA